jgi:hypothetical protein
MRLLMIASKSRECAGMMVRNTQSIRMQRAGFLLVLIRSF